MKWNRLESTGIWADSTVQQPRPLLTHPRPVQDPSGNLRTVKVLQRYTILSQGTWYRFIKCHWPICEWNWIEFNSIQFIHTKVRVASWKNELLKKRVKKHPFLTLKQTHPESWIGVSFRMNHSNHSWFFPVEALVDSPHFPMGPKLPKPGAPS